VRQSLSAGDLLRRVRRELKLVTDPIRAPAMRSYMKSEMPFLGVNNPIRQRVCRPVFKTLTFPTAEAWRNAVLGLWRGAKYREERYAAIDLSSLRRFDSFQTLQALPMYEEMIVTGAWWDYVDEIASRRLGPLLRRYPRAMRRKMLAWSKSKDLWKRRSAILCQLGFKAETDLDLLYAAIDPAIDSKEFFLRKAIGWALRQHAWTDPAEVLRYVRLNKARLSPLSTREALKNIAHAV
jgi:3-methyladenine DNA glycosylase AlkD